MSEQAAPDLARLTGVRSGKGSYYQAYVRSDERLERAVRAMDSISRALVRTIEGPRGLLEEVTKAASAHLLAPWTLLALGNGQLRGARPRFIAMDADGHTLEERDLPRRVADELAAIQAGAIGGSEQQGWVRVPMTLEGRRVGSLCALHGLEVDPEPGDLAVLRILANQAAVSLHTSEQYQAGLTLHRRAQRLRDETTAQARDLAQRTAQLRDVEHRLLIADQRELIDTERHRIARELHDSVAQYVISAGMSVEMARGDAEALGSAGQQILDHLVRAKRLSQEATEQLRRAIYALHQHQHETVSTLPELLGEVVAHYHPGLDVALRVEGDPQSLPGDVHHELARAVGEALFNVVSHARATRAVVRIRYRSDSLLLSVADDGVGDPKELSGTLRLARQAGADNRHRGLINIDGRLSDLGGSVAFRRARLGGVRVEMRLPLPVVPPSRRAVTTQPLIATTEET